MKKQAGFTLIELVVVIVILGILAAVALPKFLDVSSDARMAKMNGAVGAIKSAMAMGHAQSLINGSSLSASSNYTVEGSPINLVYGYPDVASITTAAGLSTGTNGDFQVATTATTMTLTPDTSHPNCSVTYTNATLSGTTVTAPVISTAGLVQGNC